MAPCKSVTTLALLAALATVSSGEVVFQLGEVDCWSSEFGGAKEGWPRYREIFPHPVVFTVGEDPLSAWPYIHPSNRDVWADSRPHTYTLKFTLKAGPASPLFLILGLTDSMPIPPLVTVAFNGQSAPSQRAPAGAGRGAFEPRGTFAPSTMVFRAPEKSLHAGENTITIRCETGSWIVYDYLLLTSDPNPPQPDFTRDDLIEKALALGVRHIVFAVRKPGRDGHWYANFGYYAPDVRRVTYGDGGRLCKLDLKTGQTEVLLDDPGGGVRDPQVSYDGLRVLFSYRRHRQPYYHLYEMHLDGSGMRQLTSGPYDDIEPTYLPDGDIVFCSSRCNRWVNCWLTQVAVLYRCNADGRHIRPLSSNNEHDNTPWPLPDGRLLYTRWEYVDRSQVKFHHLWTMHPDGTEQTVFFGNMHPGTVMIDAKPLPGSRRVVAVFSPGHGRREHDGAITVVDPGRGPDDLPSAIPISRGQARDPYPLASDLFLIAQPHALLLMDDRGCTQTVYSLPDADRRANLQCHEPRPLMPRPREPALPGRSDDTHSTGTMIVTDVHRGRNMQGVRPGEIKKLLILETLPKPINFTGGMEPLSYGGTFTLERVLGTVPVEADGSAHFRVPALRSVLFVALDENGLSVKRMQSFTTVQPGETITCAGCHEPRSRTPQASHMPAATRRPPDEIQPIGDQPDVFDFPRDIQPILDHHCVRCHDAAAPAGDVILSGDRGPMFSLSYFDLFARNQVADGRNGLGNRAPRTIGSSASPLMEKLRGGHYGVNASAQELASVRLWIETGAPFPGTYAALGSGMIGGYAQNRLDRSDTQLPAVKQMTGAIQSRCADCHSRTKRLPTSASDDLGRPPWVALTQQDPRRRYARHRLYNLSRPVKSAILLAPLAKAAGGWEACGRPVFADTQDTDYRRMLAGIVATQRLLEEVKRFDMPGFRPRPEYVREMVRYGVLTKEEASGPLDGYSLDRAYWRSLWLQPPQDATS